MVSKACCIFFTTLFLAFLLACPPAYAQAAPDTVSATVKKQRIVGLSAGFAAGYSSSLVLLHKAWYSQNSRSSFHFHNDLSHWKQVDKAGHFWTAFQQSRAGVDALRWAGVNEKKSIWIGGMLGIVLQTPIEIFDGYSPGYGASWSDFTANTLGSAALIAQQLHWGEIRIMPKFSFRRTAYAPHRPEMFGASLAEQILKDYNGQTYWLSVDISSFLPNESRYPKWLNLAAGYGAGEMIYGSPAHNHVQGYNAYRQFFLSPDINLLNLPVKSKLLKKVLYILSIYRIPMPALEFNSRNQLIFHPLYF